MKTLAILLLLLLLFPLSVLAAENETDVTILTLDEAEEMGIDIWQVFERQFGYSDLDELNESIYQMHEEQRRVQRVARQRDRMTHGIAGLLSAPIAYIGRAWKKKRNRTEEQKFEALDWVFVIVVTGIVMTAAIVGPRILIT